MDLIESIQKKIEDCIQKEKTAWQEASQTISNLAFDLAGKLNRKAPGDVLLASKIEGNYIFDFSGPIQEVWEFDGQGDLEFYIGVSIHTTSMPVVGISKSIIVWQNVVVSMGDLLELKQRFYIKSDFKPNPSFKMIDGYGRSEAIEAIERNLETWRDSICQETMINIKSRAVVI